MEGPASRVYGLNAFGGAINIITSTENHSNLKANLTGGQFGFVDGGVASNIVTAGLKNYLSAHYNSSDGYIKNTDFQQKNAWYTGKLNTGVGEIQLQAGHSTKSFGANSFYTPVYPDQFENTATTLTSVRIESKGRFHVSPTVYWRRNQDRFELFRYLDQAPSWYKNHNYHLTNVYGSAINSWFASSLGKSSLGAEFRSEDILSNVLGKPLFKPVPVPGDKIHQYTLSDSRKNFSFYAEHSVYTEHFSISGGVMANLNTQTGDRLNLYPGLDFSWNIHKDLKYYFSLNKSLRIPTFTDLYYKSATNVGNIDLKPEEAVAFESGFKLNAQWYTGNITYFHRWGNNIIDWVKKADETVWKAENITNLNTDGIELSSKFFIGKGLKNKPFIKYITLSYSWLDQGKQSGSYSSKYVMDYLRNKIVLGINHSIIGNLSADWKFSYQDRNGIYTKWEGSAYGKDVPYPSLYLVDARILWQNKSSVFYIELSNLLDQKFEDYSNVEQPGRWIKFGIKSQIRL